MSRGTEPIRALRALARSYGVQLSYRDSTGRVRRAGVDALVAVTRALGAPIEDERDAPEALNERADQGPSIDPVIIAWDGRMRAPVPDGRRLHLEDGTEHRPGDLQRLPFGHHRLVDEMSGRDASVISAPTRAPSAPPGSWGVFFPLYALDTERNWGVADVTDLESAMRWTTKLGGRLVATLPLQASYLTPPLADPSPYAPASRLFYNELYVDPQRAPEFDTCPAARDLVTSAAFQEEVQTLRRAELVDHVAAYALKRRVIDLLADRFFAAPRSDDLRRFLQEEPLAIDHARFRAHVERDGVRPQRWDVAREVSEDPAERYHVYAQLLAHEQLCAVAKSDAGSGLYLDLPLGVHPDGYDTWRFSDRFASQISVGAPPDAFFAGGQNWGFAPIDPMRSRQTGHDYFIASVRKLMRSAAVVRIDHVMSLHRLFWIPLGMTPEDGVYVRYPAEELYAALTLEAHRTQAAVVGEDLGTVPGTVRASMRRHGILSTFVAQFETSDDVDAAVAAPSPRSLACINTHDTPTFASFWHDLPASRRSAIVRFLRRTGALDADTADPVQVVGGLLRYLAASEAPILISALEDLWGERSPQNVPGTTSTQHPNWRRRMSVPFERIVNDKAIARVLGDVAALRAEVA